MRSRAFSRAAIAWASVLAVIATTLALTPAAPASAAPNNYVTMPDGIDIAIRLGHPPWPRRVVASPFLADRLGPVCAPGLLQGRARLRLADLRRLTLLSAETRPDAWSDWARAHGTRRHPSDRGRSALPPGRVVRHLPRGGTGGMEGEPAARDERHQDRPEDMAERVERMLVEVLAGDELCQLGRGQPRPGQHIGRHG